MAPRKRAVRSDQPSASAQRRIISSSAPQGHPAATTPAASGGTPAKQPEEEVLRRPFLRLAAAFLLALSLLPTLTLSSLAFHRILHPLFGSVATSYYHSPASFVTDTLIPLLLARWFALDLSLMCLASVLLVMRSPAVVELLKNDAGRYGAHLGPVAFQIPLEWTVRVGCVLAATAPLRTVIEHIRSSSGKNETPVFAAVLIGLHLLGRAANHLVDPLVDTFQPCSERKLAVTALAMLCLVSSAYHRSLGRRTPSESLGGKRSLNAVPFGMALIIFFLSSYDPCIPGLQSRHTLANRKSAVHQLLDRSVSLTGTVTVGEFALPSDGQVIRYLRCDHSLLGGTWIGPKRRELEEQGVRGEEMERRATEEAESVYATFVIQDAVRLVERRSKRRDGEEKALILGLGAGIAARAFESHGIATAIVEIDPVVLRFAQRYFAVPTSPKGGAFVEDARTFLRREKGRRRREEEKWDFVVHDVFTGGAVPPSLFTVECWEDVRAVLADDGVLAVNFAGDLRSRASQIVLASLQSVFPACRAFAEDTPPEEDFKNMVIFCVPGSQPPTFRPAQPDDALGSEHRWHLLSTFPSHEVVLPAAAPSLALRDGGEGTLAKAQVESAMEHWKVMRRVLPDDVWATY